MIGTDRRIKIASLKEFRSEPERVTFKLSLSFLQCCSSEEFIAVATENSINPFLRLECPPSSPDWHRRRRLVTWSVKDQSQVSIQVTWSVRDQSQASIQVTWSVLANHSCLVWSRAHSVPWAQEAAMDPAPVMLSARDFYRGYLNCVWHRIEASSFINHDQSQILR